MPFIANSDDTAHQKIGVMNKFRVNLAGDRVILKDRSWPVPVIRGNKIRRTALSQFAAIQIYWFDMSQSSILAKLLAGVYNHIRIRKPHIPPVCYEVWRCRAFVDVES